MYEKEIKWVKRLKRVNGKRCPVRQIDSVDRQMW